MSHQWIFSHAEQKAIVSWLTREITLQRFITSLQEQPTTSLPLRCGSIHSQPWISSKISKEMSSHSLTLKLVEIRSISNTALTPRPLSPTGKSALSEVLLVKTPLLKAKTSPWCGRPEMLPFNQLNPWCVISITPIAIRLNPFLSSLKSVKTLATQLVAKILLLKDSDSILAQSKLSLMAKIARSRLPADTSLTVNYNQKMPYPIYPTRTLVPME